MLTTAELLARVRRLEIRARRRIDAVFAGEYGSRFRGRGMAFDEVRPYQDGDDWRFADWNVTARTGVLHVKRFVEERELTVVLAVDASGSVGFGTRCRPKREAAAELAALLALTAVRNGDRAALLLFTDRVELFVPPRRGRSHALRLVRELVAFEPRGRGTDLSAALGYLHAVLRRRAVVVLVSDFAAEVASFARAFSVAARRHELVAVRLVDAAEERMPSVGRVLWEDAETSERSVVETSSRRFGEAFASAVAARRGDLERLVRRAGAEMVRLGPEDDVALVLERFFRRRSDLTGVLRGGYSGGGLWPGPLSAS